MAVEWKIGDNEIISVTQMPEDVFGFVYEILYKDKTKYIGKKQVFSQRIIAASVRGKVRPNTIKKIKRNVNGHRKEYDVIRTESDWRAYCGSHSLAHSKEIKEKRILEYATNQLELTYLEAKWLFIQDVLRDKVYLNDNILGKFYRGRV